MFIYTRIDSLRAKYTKTIWKWDGKHRVCTDECGPVRVTGWYTTACLVDYDSVVNFWRRYLSDWCYGGQPYFWSDCTTTHVIDIYGREYVNDSPERIIPSKMFPWADEGTKLGMLTFRNKFAEPIDYGPYREYSGCDWGRVTYSDFGNTWHCHKWKLHIGLVAPDVNIHLEKSYDLTDNTNGEGASINYAKDLAILNSLQNKFCYVKHTLKSKNYQIWVRREEVSGSNTIKPDWWFDRDTAWYDSNDRCREQCALHLYEGPIDQTVDVVTEDAATPINDWRNVHRYPSTDAFYNTVTDYSEVQIHQPENILKWLGVQHARNLNSIADRNIILEALKKVYGNEIKVGLYANENIHSYNEPRDHILYTDILQYFPEEYTKNNDGTFAVIPGLGTTIIDGVPVHNKIKCHSFTFEVLNVKEVLTEDLSWCNPSKTATHEYRHTYDTIPATVPISIKVTPSRAEADALAAKVHNSEVPGTRLDPSHQMANLPTTHPRYYESYVTTHEYDYNEWTWDIQYTDEHKYEVRTIEPIHTEAYIRTAIPVENTIKPMDMTCVTTNPKYTDKVGVIFRTLSDLEWHGIFKGSYVMKKFSVREFLNLDYLVKAAMRQIETWDKRPKGRTPMYAIEDGVRNAYNWVVMSIPPTVTVKHLEIKYRQESPDYKVKLIYPKKGSTLKWRIRTNHSSAPIRVKAVHLYYRLPAKELVMGENGEYIYKYNEDDLV